MARVELEALPAGRQAARASTAESLEVLSIDDLDRLDLADRRNEIVVFVEAAQ